MNYPEKHPKNKHDAQKTHKRVNAERKQRDQQEKKQGDRESNDAGS